jgi:hypothetical protein
MTPYLAMMLLAAFGDRDPAFEEKIAQQYGRWSPAWEPDSPLISTVASFSWQC